MPTYEYICTKCDHTFETVQPISARPLTVCPKDRCALESWGRGKVRRAIAGGAGLLFKGSGFYITDYRSEGYKAAAKKESAAPAAAGGEGQSGTKSDGKPTAKPAKSPASGS